MSYGKELTVDLKGCSIEKFTRPGLTEYFDQLCKLIDMKQEDLHFWDDIDVPEGEKRTEPHVVGITAVQFIITSAIVIHSLTILKECYINIFSCKYFDTNIALGFTRRFFGAEEFNSQVLKRGDWGNHGVDIIE